MDVEEKAFVRGFAAATARYERYSNHVNAYDLMKEISATEAMLVEAGVDEYDIMVLRPTLERLSGRR